MKKNLLKFLIIFAMSIQVLPESFVRIIAEDTSIIQNEYIVFQSENTPDSTFAKDAQLPENKAKLEVTVQLNQETKEEKYLIYEGDKQPGKLSVSALDGYVIESIKIDEHTYKNESVAFDREAGMLDKKIVINVTEKKEKVKEEAKTPVKTNEKASVPTTQQTYPYTPKGANFQILSGTGTGNDPYYIDIKSSDIYLPGDPQIHDKNSANTTDTNRYSYDFIGDYQIIYEAMLRYGWGNYKLLRSYGLNGLVSGKTYKINDPMNGSSLVTIEADKLASMSIRYDDYSFNTPQQKVKMLHYDPYKENDKVDLNIQYYLDDNHVESMDNTIAVKPGKHQVTDFGFPNTIKSEGISYNFATTNPEKEINVTNSKQTLKVYYNSNKVSQKVKVTFDPNGGKFSYNDNDPKVYTINKNSSINETIPTPEKYTSGWFPNKYTFLGWFTEDGNIYQKDLTFSEDTVYYAKWAKTTAQFYIIKKGQSKPVDNSSDSVHKYFKYGDGYLIDDPKEVNDEERVKEQILQTPEKRAISQNEYCNVNNVITKDCTGYSNDQYEAVWYRAIKENDGWHVDGYIREKTKINLEFNIIKAGNERYDYFTNIDITKGEKLSTWPDGTPHKVQKNGKTYVFSGWYTDENRTIKASLDTVYGADLVGKTVKLYAAYESVDKIKLSVANTNTVYDGENHTVGKAETSIASAKVLYSTDKEKWSTNKPSFTEVGSHKVYVKATDDNYEDSSIVEVTVEITARPITITAESKSKVYDGTPLTMNSYKISENGLAKNQKIKSVEIIGTITNVGTTANTPNNAIITAGGKDTTNNYEYDYVSGVLEITKASADKNTVTVANTNTVYDGENHTVGKAETSIASAKVLYSTDKEKWSTKKPSFTEVGAHKVYVKATDDNYEDSSIVEATIEITARPITITAESESKVYDGTPLTMNSYKISENGLAKNQKINTIIITGSITNVGKTTNTPSKATITADGKDTTNNYKFDYVSGVLEITVASADKNTVTVANTNTVYDGENHTVGKAETSIASAKVLYSTDKEKWSTKKPSFTEVGAHKVYVKATDDNYEDSSIVEATVEITARPITITAESESKVYDGTPLTMNSYKISENGLAKNQKIKSVEITGSITNVGTTTNTPNNAIITADGKDTTNNYKFDYVSGILEITKASAEKNIVIVKNTRKVYDGDSHTLSKVSTKVANSTLFYSIDNKTWSKDLPTFVDAGDYQVYVKAENPNYNDSFATGSVIIEKRDITFTANSANAVYNGTPLKDDGYAITAGILAPKQKATVKIEGSQTDVGSSANKIISVSINSTSKETTTNYNMVVHDGVLTVSSADGKENAVTLKNVTKTYDGKSYGLIDVKASKENSQIYYSIDGKTWKKDPYIYRSAGVHKIYVKATNKNYNESEVVVGFVTIQQRKLVIIAASDHKTYDGKALKNQTYTLGGEGVAEGQKVSATITGSQTNVGTSSNVASNALVKSNETNTTNNYDIHYLDGELKVTKASDDKNTVTAESTKTIYDGENHSIDKVETSVKTAKVLYSTDKEKWSTEKPSFTEAGKYTVYVQAKDDNYEDSSIVESTVEITARPITITVDSAKRAYDGTALTLDSYTISKNGLANNQKVDSIKITGTITNVGKVDNIASELVIMSDETNTTKNYEIHYVKGTLEIIKASADKNRVTAEKTKTVYDGENHSIDKVETSVKTAKVLYSTDKEKWSTEKPSFTEIGKHTVYVQAKDDNYEDSSIVESTVEITVRPITITVDSAKRAYDGTALTLDSYTISKNGLANNQKVDSIKITGTITNVGKVDNIASELVIMSNETNTTKNYEIDYVNGTLEIIKASAEKNTVTAENTKTVYDGENHSIGKVETSVKTAKVLYSTDKEKWSTEKPSFTEVGKHTVYVQAKDDNYEDSSIVESTVEITARPITITVDSAKRAYDGTALTLDSYTISKNGLAKNQKIDSIKITGTITNVGKADNIASELVIMSNETNTTKNYEIHYVNGTLEIIKASADKNTVTAENTKTVYDGENHSVDKVETSVKNSDILYSKDGKEWSKDIPTFTEAGSHKVYIKSVNDNYEDSNVFVGEVMITKRPITLTADSANKVFDNQPLTSETYQLSQSLVKGQNLKVVISGSQTEVGTSENVITTVVILENDIDKTSNYEITKVNGVLSVTAVTTPITPVTPDVPETPVTPQTPTIPGPQAPIQVIPGVVTPIIQPNQEENTEPKKDAQEEIIKDNKTPKAAGSQGGSWALFNLLFAAGTVILGIALLLSKLKKQEEDENEEEQDLPYKRKKWLRVATSATAILSVIAFCLTEDITLKMILVDAWTLLMAVIFLVQIVFFYFGKKWKEEEQEETAQVK